MAVEHPEDGEEERAESRLLWRLTDLFGREAFSSPSLSCLDPRPGTSAVGLESGRGDGGGSFTSELSVAFFLG